MKIALPGGTGFIGRHLARDLAERGHQVVVIARGQYTRGQGLPTHEGITFVQANVTDTGALTRAFSGCSAIVNCAGTSEDRSQTYRQVHVDGARSVVDAAWQAS